MTARTTLNLKYLTVAAVSLLAFLPVQAKAADSPHRPARVTVKNELRSVSGSQHLVPNPMRPMGSGKSSFWVDAGITAALLAGFLALGLWGDRAGGGVILAVQWLCVGLAWATRKVRAHAFARSRGRLSSNLDKARATGLGSSRDQLGSNAGGVERRPVKNAWKDLAHRPHDSPAALGIGLRHDRHREG